MTYISANLYEHHTCSGYWKMEIAGAPLCPLSHVVRAPEEGVYGKSWPFCCVARPRRSRQPPTQFLDVVCHMHLVFLRHMTWCLHRFFVCGCASVGGRNVVVTDPVKVFSRDLGGVTNSSSPLLGSFRTDVAIQHQ